MLMLVFRGIFIIGILSWYSTNVWKMIDGYFKDRFEQYLQAEYKKNPKMRDDVEAHKVSRDDTKNGEIDSEHARKTISSIDSERNCKIMAGVLEEEICSIKGTSDVAGDDETGSRSSSSTLTSTVKEKIVDDDLPSESEVRAKGGDYKNAFSESSRLANKVVDELSTNDHALKSPSNDRAIDSIDDDKLAKKMARPSTDISDDRSSRKKETRKKTKSRKKLIRAKIDEEMEAKAEKKKKKKVKTIQFTQEDFKWARIRSGLQDHDFSEFDDDEEEDNHEDMEGILVSELPFKPRADIGKLERVNDDEFCPLTIEDEANCDEIRTWP